MTRNLSILVAIVVIILAYFLYTAPPDADDIILETNISISENTIDYQETTYRVEFSERKTLAGDVRYIGRAWLKYTPFVTTDLILTTGEFSDPEIVKIAKVRNSHTSWRADKRPTGTLTFLHIIPRDPAVLDLLSTITEGQEVAIIGRLAEKGAITSPEGQVLRVNNTNHKIILVSDVQ